MKRHPFPEKPSLPPLFICAATLWASSAFVILCLQGALLQAQFVVCVLGILASLACGFFLYAKGACPLLLAVLGFALGFACGGQAAFQLQMASRQVADAGVQHYRFQIIEDIQETDYGKCCLVRAYSDEGRSYLVRANLSSESQAHCWDVFELKCAIRKPSRSAAAYYWKKGCVGSITPYRIDSHRPAGLLGAISSVRQAGIDHFSKQGSEGELLLRSIVFGDRVELFAHELYGKVRRVGLAHIVAVSGAHLGITVAFMAFLLRVLNVPRSVSLVLQAIVCVLYVLFTGAPHSALRACVMVLCMLFAFFGKRRSFALNALSVCVIAFIVLEPRLCMSVSLLLSALATCGIIFFSSYVSAWLIEVLDGRLKALCDILGMTISALFATLPVTLPLFAQFSLIAPLANLVAAPFFSMLCVGGMIAALLSLLVPVLNPAVYLVSFLAQVFCDLINLLASVPFAAIAVSVPAWLSAGLSFLGAVLVLRMWPHPSRVRFVGLLAGLFSFFVSFLIIFPLAHGTEIIMLDVGQGDAFVLRSGSHAVLIDTGNQDAAVLKGLARHDVRHLDAVLVSHPDDDHCGALETILDFVEVDKVLVAQDLLECSCANCSRLRSVAHTSLYEGLATGDVLSWGCFAAQVLAPLQFADEGGNADSLVLYVVADANADSVPDVSALFCGDAESEVLAQLEAREALVPVDIYKVGHHGSGGAFSQDQLDTISPQIALVSVGENNRYGHPNEEIISMLNKSQVSVFRTDESGDVVCKLEGSGLCVSTLK